MNRTGIVLALVACFGLGAGGKWLYKRYVAPPAPRTPAAPAGPATAPADAGVDAAPSAARPGEQFDLAFRPQPDAGSMIRVVVAGVKRVDGRPRECGEFTFNTRSEAQAAILRERTAAAFGADFERVDDCASFTADRPVFARCTVGRRGSSPDAGASIVATGYTVYYDYETLTADESAKEGCAALGGAFAEEGRDTPAWQAAQREAASRRRGSRRR